MIVGDGIVMEKSMWNFRGDVVKNFEEHIRKSVPFYSEGHNLVVKLSDYFTHQESICYEIGCSTGILSYKLAKHLAKKKSKIIGIDLEKDMIDFANNNYILDNCQFICADIFDFVLEKNNFTVLYYVLQFINLAERYIILKKISDALSKGGALCIFEKVRASDAQFQDIIMDLYLDYKLENGFSCEEILSKSMSLRGVLEPNTSKENIKMLYDVGFRKVYTIFRYLCFEGVLALK